MSDSPQGPIRSKVGPPPPGATRGLGVVAMFVANITIYTRLQQLSMVPSAAHQCQCLPPENDNWQGSRGGGCALVVTANCENWVCRKPPRLLPLHYYYYCKILHTHTGCG